MAHTFTQTCTKAYNWNIIIFYYSLVFLWSRKMNIELIKVFGQAHSWWHGRFWAGKRSWSSKNARQWRLRARAVACGCSPLQGRLGRWHAGGINRGQCGSCAWSWRRRRCWAVRQHPSWAGGCANKPSMPLSCFALPSTPAGLAAVPTSPACHCHVLSCPGV